MGRCWTRIRYRLTRLNPVECLVLLSCSMCLMLLVYAASLHQRDQNLLVLQDTHVEKLPNAKTKGRRSISDFRERDSDANHPAPVVYKQLPPQQEEVGEGPQYEFMELQDFDTEDEKAQRLQQQPDLGESHQRAVMVEVSYQDTPRPQEVADTRYQQQNTHKKPDSKVPEGDNSYSQEISINADEEEERKDMEKHDGAPRAVASRIYPISDVKSGKISAEDVKKGKDSIENPIVKVMNTDKRHNTLRQGEGVAGHSRELGAPPNSLSKTEADGRRTLYVQATGGLGNKMFQYASLIGVAEQTVRKPVITPDAEMTVAFKSFSAQVGYIPGSADLAQVHESRSAIYSSHLLSLPLKDTLMCCYLQSWRYFQLYEDLIRRDFTFNDIVSAKAKAALDRASFHHKAKVRRLKQEDPSILDFPHYTYVGVHVRRGDYTSEHYHAKGYVTAPASYVQKAMAYFKSKYSNALFIVVSDDIQWCKTYLSGSDIEFVSTGEAAVDLALLAECKHTIMTVGSFSWWAAWLAGGEVVYYSGWPLPGSELDKHVARADYFLPTWVAMGD